MWRRLFRLLVVLSVLLVLGVAAVWVVSTTDFGRERARRFLVNTLAANTHGVVRVGAVHGNLLEGATLVRVSITDSAGAPFFRADSLSARYRPRDFLSQRIVLTDLVLYRPDVVVSRLPGKKWNYRILWPATTPTPGDTVPGWGSWVRFEDVTVRDGTVTVRSPWEPRTGVTARERDSIVADVLSAGSRLHVVRAPGGFQKIVSLRHIDARLPLVRIADPQFANRLARVAALRMDAYPFRPPAAQVRALTGSFTFNDDSLWWKGAAVRLPGSALRGDGIYNLDNGDMRLSMTASPARFVDFRWLYERFPDDGGGTLGLNVIWRGASQDYVVRNADVRSEGAHVTGDVGVTVTDTVVFHDGDLRFRGVTTRQIAALDPTLRAPRQGVLSGAARFAGTFRRLDVDGDVTFQAYGRGTSRVIGKGIIGWTPTTPVVVSARDFHVRVAPLQIDIVKLLFPTLPVGGTLTGVATLNGSGATQLVATGLDIVHQDGHHVSHAVGRAQFHTLAPQTMELDVDARPLALGELTKFAPSLPFTGLAYGPVRAHGRIDALAVETRLRVPGGGTFGLRGTVDFLSKELGYDVVADATALDLSQVLSGGPRTALNGGGRARGRGFKPATMYADLALALHPSLLDTVRVDSVLLRARLGNGLATISQAEVRASGAQLAVAGQLGLDRRHAGALTYSVVVDSLARFAAFIPGAGAADTGAVSPRPRLIQEAIARARADSARLSRETEVARAASGAPPVRLQVDTPRAIPRGIVSGSLRASGTVTGSVDRFTLQGTASGSGLIVRGNAAQHVEAAYSWVDARTARSRLSVDLRGDTLSAFGFAFDSLAAQLSYTAPRGTVALRVRQAQERDYSLRGDFTVDRARSELRLADVLLRFDSTLWRSPHPATLRFGSAGVEVVNFELLSGPGRRIYANGLLPTKGRANFDLEVTDFAVENVAELLQSDLAVTGRLTLDAHVSGTAADPSIRGRVDFVRGTYGARPVPELHGTFAYADRQLTTNATASDSTGRSLATVAGVLPIDLALSGVTGPRLLDRPLNVTLASDSLPLQLIPQLTDAVTDVAGQARANVRVAGTLRRPELRGDVTLRRAQFRLAATGAFLHDVNGTVRMTGDTVYIDSIAGIANGPVRLAGTAAVGNWRDPALDLVLLARDAELLNNERGDIHADAGLRIAGPVNKLYVSGQVTVLHGVLYIPESSGKKIIGPGDPQLFSVIDTAVALQRGLFPAQSPMFANLRADVDLAVERNTWVRSRDANVEIYTDGPMRLNVVGDALTITGVVNADRGEYTFLSRRFQITRGSALFIGSPDLNPTVQITAEYQVKQPTGVTNIRVLVGGTVERPRISLESDAQPPLSQSDLLSFLAFGESTSSLLQLGTTSLSAGQGGNLINLASARLAGVAIGEALNQLEGQTARSLGVDIFNITPGELPLTNAQAGLDQFLRGTEIEAGKYVNPRTFVTFIVAPGALAVTNGQNRAPPGASIVHRTAKGFRYEASYSPRYILSPPTLAGQTFAPTGQFGAFIIREWRF